MAAHKINIPQDDSSSAFGSQVDAFFYLLPGDFASDLPGLPAIKDQTDPRLLNDKYTRAWRHGAND